MKTKKSRTNYLNGNDTVREIWKSKLTYCSHPDPLPQRVKDCDFDYSGEEPTGVGLERIFTFNHIPANDGKQRSRRLNPEFMPTNFRPFSIFQDGVEIVRSHWRGDFETGAFTLDKGRITNALGLQMQTMITRIGRKPNFIGYSYNDEMQSGALVHLIENGLKFDDTRTNNAFAYFTTVIINAFIRVLNDEKKVQNTRDDLLVSMGASPSYSYADRPLNSR